MKRNEIPMDHPRPVLYRIEEKFERRMAICV